MRRKPGFAGDQEASPIRLAWLASFAATIVLIAILGMARSAQALPIPVPAIPALPGTPLTPSTPVVAVEDEEEECEIDGECEEEEFEAEECEEPEEEGEECEGEGAGASGAEAPVECRLRSASATVSADPARDKLSLSLRYTTFSPTSVAFDYFLRGSKGPLSLGGGKKHFARKGALHETKRLTGPQMAKVLAAKDFTVQLRPADVPHSCNRLLDRHLTIRHAAGGNLTWSDPEAGFRASRAP
jgi:hypothetical protein